MSMLFGICFLAIQCRNNDNTDEFDGGGSHDELYVVDSFSIWLSNAQGEELHFDSSIIEASLGIKDITFNIDFKELKYVFHSKSSAGFGFEALAIPAPRSILKMSDVEVTSDKDIVTIDSTITAGTDLSSLFVYSWEHLVGEDEKAGFLLSEYESAYNRPRARGFYARLSIELKEALDQSFSIAITAPDGKKVAAHSPRVLAK